MRTALPKRNVDSKSPIKLDDSWNQIGVWGNRECGELKKVVHWRDCTVYSSAAAPLLLEAEDCSRTIWKVGPLHFAAVERIVETRQMQAALIFRIGSEWLALSATHIQEILEGRPIHSLPHGRSNTLAACSLANIAWGRSPGLRGARSSVGFRKMGPGRVELQTGDLSAHWSWLIARVRNLFSLSRRNVRHLLA